jgi:hypothetical protein
MFSSPWMVRCHVIFWLLTRPLISAENFLDKYNFDMLLSYYAK